jgi:hypothetical protein
MRHIGGFGVRDNYFLSFPGNRRLSEVCGGEGKGILIIDDYFHLPACKQAVEQYRAENAIAEAIVRIDAQGAYWRKVLPPKS